MLLCLSSGLLIDPLLNINNNNHESVDKELSAEERDRLSPLPSVSKRYKHLSVYRLYLYMCKCVVALIIIS